MNKIITIITRKEYGNRKKSKCDSFMLQLPNLFAARCLRYIFLFVRNTVSIHDIYLLACEAKSNNLWKIYNFVYLPISFLWYDPSLSSV